jgi:Family of unknown function (DUF5309)
MAIVTNTFTTYDAIGVREQWDDLIFNIAPTDTPFMSGIGKGKATNIYFWWQTDSLAGAANNAQLDGDDVSSYTAVTPTVKQTGTCQISRKSLVISASEQAVLKAGRKDEVAYQTMLKVKELKRDIETALCQNTTSVAGTTTTARQTRGLEGWVATNNSLGASGAAPAPLTNTAPTDGTQRAFTEALLKSVAQSVFTAGGDPDMLMVGPAQKQVVSTFTGNATRMKDAKDGELQAAISVYTSDFGTFKIAPNRFQRNRTAFLLQSEMWKLMTLRPMQVVDLAKTGDADKKLIVWEYGLQANQEASGGAIRDLT